MSATQDTRERTLPRVHPAADIVQRDHSYYIVLDMPGVRKEDLDVTVDKDVLTVAGETSYPDIQNQKQWENEFGNVYFVRKFTLSDAVDRDKVKASMKNGVVTLHLPRAERVQPKKIEIESG
jgi:HSP20 family molecular chaperone IbpA